MTVNNGPSSSRLGGTVGRRLAAVVADATAATRAKTTPSVTRAVNQVIADWFRIIDAEARQAMEPLLRPIVDSPELPPEARAIMRAITRPTGQWQAFLAQNAAGTAVSVGLGALLNNLLAGPVQEQLSRLPNSLLDPGTAAAAEVRGFRWSRPGAGEARRSAVSDDRFNVLKLLAQNQPDPAVVIEGVRRGSIGPGTASTLLRRGGWSDAAIELFLDLRRVLLTPEQLNEMFNRSIVSMDEGKAIAAQQGLAPGDFERLTELGGVPLAPQELAEAFRRGFINQARFRRGIVQGPIRNEWFDVLEALQDRRMSPQNAAQAVLQGKMSVADGRMVARAAGLNADDFTTIINSTGQPPGISLMQEAWNRGIITEREFETAFLESNLKNRWIDVMKATRFRVMPREQINITYRFGGFTKAQAIERYKWFGFSREDAEAMLRAEDARKLGPQRDLSITTILDLYEGAAITRGDAIDFLRTIGFDDDETALMLAVRDVRQARRIQNLAVSRVRSQFTRFKIDERAAVTALDRLGIIPTERDGLIDTWRIEREVTAPVLTTSQIQQAVRRGLITPEEAFGKFKENGYADDDAAVLTQLAIPAQ